MCRITVLETELEERCRAASLALDRLFEDPLVTPPTVSPPPPRPQPPPNLFEPPPGRLSMIVEECLGHYYRRNPPDTEWGGWWQESTFQEEIHRLIRLEKVRQLFDPDYLTQIT